MSNAENPYRSPETAGHSKHRGQNILNGWFILFPIWSVAFYVWFVNRVLPFTPVSPLLPPDDWQYIAPELFALCIVCMALIAFTIALTCYILHRRLGREWRQLAWTLLVLAIPPMGCPLAYLVVKSRHRDK